MDSQLPPSVICIAILLQVHMNMSINLCTLQLLCTPQSKLFIGHENTHKNSPSYLKVEFLIIKQFSFRFPFTTPRLHTYYRNYGLYDTISNKFLCISHLTKTSLSTKYHTVHCLPHLNCPCGTSLLENSSISSINPDCQSKPG